MSAPPADVRRDRRKAERPDLRLVWSWFVALWRENPGWLAWITLASFANAALVVAFPWQWQYVVDAIGAGQDVGHLAAGLIVAVVAQGLLYIALQGSRTWMNAVIQRATRTRTFDHASTLPDAFFARWRTGDLVARLTDDAGEKTSWFLCSGVFRALEAVLVMAASLAAMAHIDVGLAVRVAAPLPALVILQALLQQVLAGRYKAVQQAISAIHDELGATFGAIRIVQACGLAPAARARFVAQASAQRDAEVRSARVNQAIFLMYGYGWMLAVGVLLLEGGPAVLDGRITLGQLVSFEGFLMALVWPMFDVGMFVARAMQAGVSLTRLQEVLDAAPTPDGGAAEPDGHAIVGRFGTSVGGKALLTDVDVDLRPGMLVAVVGEVGAGKSTLLRVLAQAMPAEGSLTFGGADVGEVSRSAFRSAVAHVPQDPVVLSVSLRDNITLGREVSADDLARAVRISRLEQDLPAFAEGLATAVGERGVTLSGGQQQRLALARALVGQPSVLLLDDATAALDADTEAAFWAALEEVLPDVTAVVVTHRVGTLERADVVLVLQDGRIVERGTSAELLARDGVYRRIYGRMASAEKVAVNA